MQRTEISALYEKTSQYVGQILTVCGWARTIRDSKALGFIDLNDGSCFKGVQIVFEAEKIKNYKEIAKQNVGVALCVTGVSWWKRRKQSSRLKFMRRRFVSRERPVPSTPPSEKRHSVEYLRTIAHLRPRTNLFSAAFRVRSAAAFAIHRFFLTSAVLFMRIPH